MSTLLYAIQNLNFNSLYLTPNMASVLIATNQSFILTATNVVDDTNYFWVIENVTTLNSDFGTTSGNVFISNNVATITISALNNINATPYPKTFRIQIHKNSITGPVIFTSALMSIVNHV